MNQPADWECQLYSKVMIALEEGGKTNSSYYVLVEEELSKCKQLQERLGEQ